MYAENFQYTKDQTKVAASELLMEIQAVIKDFFICNTEEKENSLFISLENGQKFRLDCIELIKE